ncbi:MAG: PAS domain-containing protein [Bernardetiaceae bacterium]
MQLPDEPIDDLRLYKKAFLEKQAIDAAITQLQSALHWKETDTTEGWGAGVLAVVAELMDFAQGVIYGYHAEHSSFEPFAYHTEAVEEWMPYRSYRNRAVMRYQKEHLLPFHTNDAAVIIGSFPGYTPPEDPTQQLSLVSTPLTYNGQIHGILEILCSREIAKRDLELLGRMGRAIGSHLYGLLKERQSQLDVQLINESRQDLVHIIESSPSGMIIFWEENGRIERVNSAITQILGYAKVELRYNQFEQLVFPEDYPTSGGLPTHPVEWRLLHKSGEVCWCQVNFSRVLQRSQPMVIVQVQDITERKKAEAELEASRQKLAEAQRLARMGSWEWDMVNNTVTWSDELYRLYGYDPKEYLPAYHNSFKRVHPEDRDRVRSTIRQAIEKGDAFDFFQRIVRQDGQIRILHSRGTVLKDKGGKPIKIFGTGQDVTETKAMERKLLEQERALQQKLERQVQERTRELQAEKEKLQQTNNEILSSMTYARRIQLVLLPQKKQIKKHLSEFFIYYVPKDIVSGDFYWFGVQNNRQILAVVDCTGHGIPGALMSMIGNDLLNEIVYRRDITEPQQILEELNQGIRRALRQSTTRNRDGMDVALCTIDYAQQQLCFAGAHNPLVYVQGGELFYIKGERRAIGGVQSDQSPPFRQHCISIREETMFYLFSDGYQDQFGGPKGAKFMSRRFRQLLLEIAARDMDNQELALDQRIGEWMGNSHKQIDDILVIGVRISPENKE